MTTATMLYPTPVSRPPFVNSNIENISNRETQAALLILVPVGIIVLIVFALLGTYKWQQAERGREGLCRILQQRIRRGQSRDRSSTALVDGGRITMSTGYSTSMLVEELTKIDADIWDAHLDEDLDDDNGNEVQQTTTNQLTAASNQQLNDQPEICTVEIHADPHLDNEGDQLSDSPQRTQSSEFLSLPTSQEAEVPAQALDPPLETSPLSFSSQSYYSPENRSDNSQSSECTIQCTDTPTPHTESEQEVGDVAQEIVDVVQSDPFAEDTAGVVRCGSSQLTLNTSSHECRGSPSQLDVLSPTRVSSSTPVRRSVCPSQSGQDKPEWIVIPLNDLDNNSQFGSSIVWEEDWDQELQTTL